MRRGKRTSDAGVHLRSSLDSLAETTRKVRAPNHHVMIGIFPNVNSISLVRVGNSVISARLHRQVEGQPGKKAKKDGVKSAVALLKNVRQLGFPISEHRVA